MKTIILLIFFTMTLFSCQDTRSRKRQNREQNPPQKLFEGKQLQAAQRIFEEDDQGLKETLNKNPEIIDELSNIKGYTLLMYASILENLNAMTILLDKGADPDIIIPYLDDTPLSHAVATNNYEMAKLLFKYKANPNPAVGNSPLCAAMSLGNEQTEKKMINFLLDNGADINHTSYLGENIMEESARNLSQFRIALYLLEKGGNPKIKGTELSPMAKFIEYEKKRTAEFQNPKAAVYVENLSKIYKMLQEKYHITFPVKDDPKAKAKLRIDLYEKLSEKDKRSVNFNKNYGENRYEKDKQIISE